jgi:hypothetical protein
VVYGVVPFLQELTQKKIVVKFKKLYDETQEEVDALGSRHLEKLLKYSVIK